MLPMAVFRATVIEWVRCSCKASGPVHSMDEAEQWCKAHHAESGCTDMQVGPGILLKVLPYQTH